MSGYHVVLEDIAEFQRWKEAQPGGAAEYQQAPQVQQAPQQASQQSDAQYVVHNSHHQPAQHVYMPQRAPRQPQSFPQGLAHARPLRLAHRVTKSRPPHNTASQILDDILQKLETILNMQSNFEQRLDEMQGQFSISSNPLLDELQLTSPRSTTTEDLQQMKTTINRFDEWGKGILGSLANSMKQASSSLDPQPTNVTYSSAAHRPSQAPVQYAQTRTYTAHQPKSAGLYAPPHAQEAETYSQDLGLNFDPIDHNLDGFLGD